MKKLYYFMLIICSLALNVAMGQDPTFAQYFSAPLNINPALAGNINTEWRLITNVRDQWSSPASPYVTGSVSFDKRILQNRDIYKPKGNSVVGIGGMLMFDEAMNGVVRSNYASLNLAYFVKLSDGPVRHKLGAGFGASYGRKYIDFTRLDFQAQFTGFGFNRNLPTGEAALSSMKGYFSASTGLTYSITTDNTNIDFGVAAFHVNKPTQTFLKDQNQFLAMRKVIHGNIETYLGNNLVLSTNAIYQYQSEARYMSAGAILGYHIPTSQGILINAGAWYWFDNGYVPYLGVAVKDFQFGITYDIVTSSLNQAARRPNTFELTLIIRGKKDPVSIESYPDVLSFPWK